MLPAVVGNKEQHAHPLPANAVTLLLQGIGNLSDFPGHSNAACELKKEKKSQRHRELYNQGNMLEGFDLRLHGLLSCYCQEYTFIDQIVMCEVSTRFPIPILTKSGF